MKDNMTKLTAEELKNSLEEMERLRKEYDLDNEDLYYLGAGLITLEEIKENRGLK